MTDWLTMTQAAQVLGVSDQTVRNLADKGKLELNRTPLGRLVSAQSVEKLRTEREVKA